MTGRPDEKGESRDSGGKREAIPSAVTAARTELSKALTAVFSAAVYNREELQSTVCAFVVLLKQDGESSDDVVRATQSLVSEVAANFPASDRTQLLLADMVSWCLAEYYRESA